MSKVSAKKRQLYDFSFWQNSPLARGDAAAVANALTASRVDFPRSFAITTQPFACAFSWIIPSFLKRCATGVPLIIVGVTFILTLGPTGSTLRQIRDTATGLKVDSALRATGRIFSYAKTNCATNQPKRYVYYERLLEILRPRERHAGAPRDPHTISDLPSIQISLNAFLSMPRCRAPLRNVPKEGRPSHVLHAKYAADKKQCQNPMLQLIDKCCLYKPHEQP